MAYVEPTYFNRISIMTFAIISIIGLVLAVIPLIALLFFVLFIISYLLTRHAIKPGIMTYIFILTAPGIVSGLLGLFVPTFGFFSEFIGIFISYMILSGRNFLD